MIKLENEKLIFEKDTCPFNPGDRISIVYEQKNDIIYPVIGLNDILSDSSSYKLTNSYNINLKGKNYKYLLSFGTEFVIEKIKEHVFKLIPITKGIEIQEEVIDYDSEIIDDNNYEIDLINKIL